METGSEGAPTERLPTAEVHAAEASAAEASTGGGPSPAAAARGDVEWRGVERALLRMRRTVLLLTVPPILAAQTVLLWALVGPVWTLLMTPLVALTVFGWFALGRNWRSWRYAERADDLLISRGVLWREMTVVPYGRMQLVEVTSGPLERRYGLARLQLHTAAAATDAAIPGLVPEEAERLRDRLTELGEARSAGL
ncbi:PH domain-containing protein [Streptomyces sp. OF3]|uniref:PH domain-containing protein n=1 Tax=Streptomyces alkaliterrae TaxID=2213162 RepID=A0A7W3ZLA0_9ACTN|nr:PH domain-containing protein [Streptomyces alkaliterrae]MBB1252654.1 PH domain-containing protein [Streptomyces alkaliterrae]